MAKNRWNVISLLSFTQYYFVIFQIYTGHDFSIWIFQVALHFWGTGGGALPVTSFLFLRDLCIRLGSDCLDECYKGMYKAYVLNCQFVNATKLQHIQFLGNCVIELFRVDLSTAYQHAFVFIRQLAMILREALNTRTKVTISTPFLFIAFRM